MHAAHWIVYKNKSTTIMCKTDTHTLGVPSSASASLCWWNTARKYKWFGEKMNCNSIPFYNFIYIFVSLLCWVCAYAMLHRSASAAAAASTDDDNKRTQRTVASLFCRTFSLRSMRFFHIHVRHSRDRSSVVLLSLLVSAHQRVNSIRWITRCHRHCASSFPVSFCAKHWTGVLLITSVIYLYLFGRRNNQWSAGKNSRIFDATTSEWKRIYSISTKVR